MLEWWQTWVGEELEQLRAQRRGDDSHETEGGLAALAAFQSKSREYRDENRKALRSIRAKRAEEDELVASLRRARRDVAREYESDLPTFSEPGTPKDSAPIAPTAKDDELPDLGTIGHDLTPETRPVEGGRRSRLVARKGTALIRGKRYGAKEIIGKLREAEVGLAQGQTVAQVVRKLGISERTYY